MRSKLLVTTAVFCGLAAPAAFAQQQEQPTLRVEPQPSQQQQAQQQGEAGQQDLQQAFQQLQQTRQEYVRLSEQGETGPAVDQARQNLDQALAEMRQALDQAQLDEQQTAQIDERFQQTEQAMTVQGADGYRQVDQAVDGLVVEVERAGLVRSQTAAAQGSEQAGDGGQITVEQASPQVQVEQAQPEIAVQQPAPEVTVQQPQPEITVQQPQPEVAVQQAAPQVTVQQPEPEVAVQQAEPQVEVQQAEPQVEVQQAEPQVQLQQSQPQVQLQQAGEPEVTIQQAEPEVVFEQAGEPQITLERDGETVPTESQAAAQAEEPTETQAAVEDTEAQPAADGQQQAALPAEGAQQPGTATSAGQVAADDMIGRNVVGTGGEDIGEIEDLVVNPQTGEIERAIISRGGFLGMGERRIAIDWAQLEVQPESGDLVTSMTEADLEVAPEYEYSEADNTVVGPRTE